jgi:hypothetical protein
MALLTQDPEDAIEDAPVVHPWHATRDAARFAMKRSEQLFDGDDAE